VPDEEEYREQFGHGGPVAKPDYVKVMLEVCRRSLAGIEPEPEQLFDDSDDLADAIERHPSGGDAA
jgi:hypothetical protein